MKFQTQDRATGTVINEFATFSEAEAAVEQYEEADKIVGNFEENYYEITEKN